MLQRIKSFFDETDIQTLVYIPPLLGFGGYLVYFLILEWFLEKPVPEFYVFIGVGTASLFQCVAGIAEIYKKEAPYSLDKVIKGNMAVVSGVVTVILFGVGGIFCFVYGVSILILK